MKPSLLFILVAVVLCGSLWAQDFFLPFAQKAVDPMVIDGNLDEWNFCFPIDVNMTTNPDNARTHNFAPEDDFDLSGTIKIMWDEEYLYVSAYVHDDFPAVLPESQTWNADAIEIYIGNYDVGHVPWDQEQKDGVPDTEDGLLATQLGFYYDGDADTTDILQWSPVALTSIKSEKTKAVGKIWENYLGYTLEARVAWADIQSDNGNTFNFTGGEVVPFTFSLYDRDDYSDDDFQGYAFSEDAYPAYQGPGKGWQVLEIRGERETPYYKDASPYMKEAAAPVEVDGELNEWNFCFPVDMNQNSIPDYSRAFAWFPLDNIDLKAPLKFMYDENYLYMGAHIQDDFPGVVPQHAYWSSDAVEIYIGNYDIGAMMTVPDHEGYANEGDLLDVQIGFYYDDVLDSADIYLWNPPERAAFVPLGDSKIVGKLWEDGFGYDLEARISLAELAVMVDDAGERTFDFAGNVGAIFPATYALYDRDEWDTDDFNGYQYVSDEAAPFHGPAAGGWEGVEIAPVNLYDILGELWETYTVVENEPEIVSQYHLSQNYPNPFNPSTVIDYSLSKTETVTLTVYNLLGEQVATLVDAVQSPGAYSISFDASRLPGGIYFYQLKTPSVKETRRMILLQ